ncbi:hypothetical protein F8S13_10465 [Chloroflexia bacterium SDU3-3]|nr:hypothetical protein F8S13_10465 [Chloroflexia bacterium SDU3-3]
MEQAIARAVIVLVVAVVLAIMAIRSKGLRFRQLSFGLFSAALVLLGISSLTGIQPLVWVAMALLAGMLVCYALSWSTGEVRKQQDAFIAKMAEAAKKHREASSK